ncbi:MAG TPA: MFS transporter [Burkholderiaceae bacterium]|nr:MFS transporter [Burkholderiaceae bacterium]
MKAFYGWRMVAAAGGIQFIHAGLLHQAFGAYLAVLTVERGWSKTSLSGAAALQSMEAALIGPALGWVIDRFGPQVAIRAGILMFGAGLMLMSQVETIAGFYGAIIVVALGLSLSGYFPLNVAIIHWFERYRARALAVSGLGLALGGVAVPAVAWSLQTYGWRSTAFASGVLAIVVGWPLARMIRRRPEDVGQTVDGLPPPARTPAPGSAAVPDDAPEFSVRQAVRTRAFWLLALGHGFALLVVTAVNVHAINHMSVGLGYTVAEASWIITLMTLSQVGGVLLGGAIGDRIEKRYVAAACMLMHAAGLLLLTYATDVWMLVMFALLHGSAWGIRGPFMQAIRADYFGRRSIGMILGLSSLIISVGQVGGPLVAGVLGDLTGNYRAGFTVLAAIAATGSLMFVLAIRPRLPPQ